MSSLTSLAPLPKDQVKGQSAVSAAPAPPSLHPLHESVTSALDAPVEDLLVAISPVLAHSLCKSCQAICLDTTIRARCPQPCDVGSAEATSRSGPSVSVRVVASMCAALAPFVSTVVKGAVTAVSRCVGR